MAQIGCLLWALFFIVLGFSMMPGAMALIMSISFIGGLADAYRKNKKRKEMEERERQKRREKWRRIANGKSLNDDFDHV